MEVGTGISAATTENTNIIMNRRGCTTTLKISRELTERGSVSYPEPCDLGSKERNADSDAANGIHHLPVALEDGSNAQKRQMSMDLLSIWVEMIIPRATNNVY